MRRSFRRLGLWGCQVIGLAHMAKQAAAARVALGVGVVGAGVVGAVMPRGAGGAAFGCAGGVGSVGPTGAAMPPGAGGGAIGGDTAAGDNALRNPMSGMIFPLFICATRAPRTSGRARRAFTSLMLPALQETLHSRPFSKCV